MGSRKRVLNLLHVVQSERCKCPAHSQGLCNQSFKNSRMEYAFEIRNSTIRFGPGVTTELGMEVKNMKATRCCIMTDQNLAKLPCVKTAMKSISRYGIYLQIFDKVRIEPTDKSLQEAIHFAKSGKFDCYIAVGGGSVIDTCKVANLYASNPEAQFLDFVSKPIGCAGKIKLPLKPLIAVPTTSGSGSETTGVAIFGYGVLGSKAEISYSNIRPTLALIDPINTATQPQRVTIYSGFDVMCHALESFTALPYDLRITETCNQCRRPEFQGQNPLSDVWARFTLNVIRKYFRKAVCSPNDIEARSYMLLASCMAGVGYGNAGVHLCHGLSYPISSNVKKFKPQDYCLKHSIIPHGLAVIITAPAVFSYTAKTCPERHLEAAELLGTNIANAKVSDAGKILANTLLNYMQEMKIENGLEDLNYTSCDISKLVAGTLPQKHLFDLAPLEQCEEDLTDLLEKSLKIY